MYRPFCHLPGMTDPHLGLRQTNGESFSQLNQGRLSGKRKYGARIRQRGGKVGGPKQEQVESHFRGEHR